jgi:hypothetical protein
MALRDCVIVVIVIWPGPNPSECGLNTPATAAAMSEVVLVDLKWPETQSRQSHNHARGRIPPFITGIGGIPPMINTRNFCSLREGLGL